MFGRVAKLEKACSQNPDVPLFARLADLYLHRGMVHRALALCEEGCERFPKYATGYMILSKCYEAQEKLEAARMAIDKALRLDPENPGGFVHLSRIYQDLGIPTLALKSLQQAASLDPFSEDLSQELETLVCEIDSAPPSYAEDLKTAEESPAPDTAVAARVAPEPLATTTEIESTKAEAQETAIVVDPERDRLPGEAMVAVEVASYEALPSAAISAGENQAKQAEDETPDQVAPLPEAREQAEEQPGPTESEAAADSLVAEVSDSFDEPKSAGAIDDLPPDLFLEEAEIDQAEGEDSLVAEIGSPSDDSDAGDYGLDLYVEEEPEKPALDRYSQDDMDHVGTSTFDDSATEEIKEEDAPLLELILAEPASPTESNIPELISFDAEQVVEEPPAETGISELLTFDEEQEQGTQSAELDSVDQIAFEEQQTEGQQTEEEAPAAPQAVDPIAFGHEQKQQEFPPDTQTVDLIALEEEQEKQAAAENNTVEIVAFDELQTEEAENSDVVELVAIDEGATKAPLAPDPAPPEPLPSGEEPTVPPSQSELEPLEDLKQEEIATESERQNKPAHSGLGPQNDAELINIFQEIENEQTQAVSVDLSAPDLTLEDKDELIATETLAEIYSNQGLTQRAIETYRQILEQQPDNESIRNKLTYLEQHMGK